MFSVIFDRCSSYLFGGGLDPHLVLESKIVTFTLMYGIQPIMRYLGVGCKVCEGSDVQAELAGLAELAEACAKRDQVVARKVDCAQHDLLTAAKRVKESPPHAWHGMHLT